MVRAFADDASFTGPTGGLPGGGPPRGKNNPRIIVEVEDRRI
jgi:hypothetical protein